VYASFEEVSELSETRVLELLETGDQTERVWAAWALGMRLAGDSRADLSERLDGEPTRGVRQHLAVVLAGLDAVEPIAAIAVNDPSIEVRITAARLCTRLLGADRVDVARRLAAQLDREATPDVAAALLAEVRADSPALLRERVARSIRSEHLALRRAAATAVLRWDADRFPAALREPALLEPDPALAADLLGRWCAREGAAPILDALADHEPAVIAGNLRRLAAITGLSWPQVARFAAPANDAITGSLLDAVGDLDAGGWRWLLSLVERNDADSRALDRIDDPIRGRAIARLRELSPNPAAVSLSYVDRPFLEAAERLVEQAGDSQALVPLSRSRWWGLRITADDGVWLELARRIYPDADSAELICHACAEGDLNVVSYRDGARAHLLVYLDDREPGVEVDLARFTELAAGRALRLDRESGF
jgi:hypothetical protein